jgi:acetoacetyl-CoA reductase
LRRSTADPLSQQALGISMMQRIAVVTGGIGGLGTAICKRLADSGRQVFAADLGARSERIAQFNEDVSAYAGRIRFAAVNVADFDDCARMIAEIKHSGPVDILVNAAGITRDVSLRKMSPQQWHDVLNVNLDGVFNMCRHVVDDMCERGFGRVVNISSINGQTGQFGQTNYSASKAGLHGFTMAMAREVARKGVTVNSVSPGYCRTAMVETIPEAIRTQIISSIPVGRIGEPEEIARAVDFLTADDAGFITGVNLPVNGGGFISF